MNNGAPIRTIQANAGNPIGMPTARRSVRMNSLCETGLGDDRRDRNGGRLLRESDELCVGRKIAFPRSSGEPANGLVRLDQSRRILLSETTQSALGRELVSG